VNRAEYEARLQTLGDWRWIPPGLNALVETMEFDGGHDFSHLARVLTNAQQIGLGEAERADIDWEVISAAVTFHDAINLPKNSPQRHLASTKSAEFAVGILGEFMSEQQLVRVEEAIRTHSFSSGFEPECIEARIVTDADRLESLGAFGIARTFYVGGRMGGSILHQADPFGRNRALDDRNYSLDHFFAKLLTLKDKMTTDAGRELAAQRHRFLEQFIEQIALELGDEV
jgi:uncharacterized protein